MHGKRCHSVLTLFSFSEKTHSKPGKVLLQDDASLKTNIATVLSRGVQIGSGSASESASEKTSLCVQRIPAEEKLEKNDVLVEAIQWFVMKNAIGRKEEIILKDTSNVRELRCSIASRHPEIPLQFVCCAKALKVQLADVESTCSMHLISFPFVHMSYSPAQHLAI